MKFRHLLTAFLLIITFSSAAGANDSADYVVYYDSDYPVKWMSKAAASEVKEFLATLGFEEMTADALESWMDTSIESKASGSILVMAQDVIPETVVGAAPGPDALVRKYLDSGGTLIWMGDVPFYFVGRSGKKVEKWDYVGGRAVLGFDTVGNWQANSESIIAGKGKEWGLSRTGLSIRPVKEADITNKLAVDANGDVSAWTKQYAEGSAGFIRLWDGKINDFTDEMGEDLYRVISNISESFDRDRKFGSIYLFKPSDYWPLIHMKKDGVVREVQVSVFDNTPGDKAYWLQITKEGVPLHSEKLFDDARSFFKKNFEIPLLYRDQKLSLIMKMGDRKEIIDEVDLDEQKYQFDLEWSAYPEINPVDIGTFLVPGDRLLLGDGQSLNVEVKGIILGDGAGRPIELSLRIVDKNDNVFSSVDQFEEFEPGSIYNIEMQTAAGKLLPGKYRAEFRAFDKGELVCEEYKWVVIKDIKAADRGFGAYEADLKYEGPVLVYDREKEEWAKKKWDDLWLKGPHSDIVVSFPNGNRFVFWRGSSNVPFWASKSNVGMTYEWLEASWGRGGLVDCIEPLQDKKCRYSRPFIVESNSARVVIRWRYALIDLEYTMADEEWAEETYTFYPDGFGVRKLTGHMLPMTWHEANEFIVFTPAAVNPFDILPSDAVEILSPDGKKKETISYPQPDGKWYKGEPAVFRVHYSRDDENTPIMAVRQFDHFIVQYDGWKEDGRYISPSYWGVHYPVTRNYPTTTTVPPMWKESPAHASLTAVESAPLKKKYVNKQHEMVTWTWMIGNTDMSDEELVMRTRNWIDPVKANVLSGGSGGEYDSAEMAYVVNYEAGAFLTIQFDGASHDMIANPAFILNDYSNPEPQIWLNGRKLKGPGYKMSIEKDWHGDRGVFWFDMSIPANSKIEIR